MADPVNVSPDWITEHAHLAAWLLGSAALTALSLLSFYAKRLFSAVSDGLDDIRDIKETQTVQASNHLSHIEAHTQETRDSMKEMCGKFDALIAVLVDKKKE